MCLPAFAAMTVKHHPRFNKIQFSPQNLRFTSGMFALFSSLFVLLAGERTRLQIHTTTSETVWII
jgi:hypothetical protein